MRARVFKDDGEMIGVYSITAPSGKKYIGMTCDSFTRRWRSHKRKLRAGNHHCVGLQYAFNKYGLDGLIVEIVQSWVKPHTEQELKDLEPVILKAERDWWERFSNDGIVLYNGKPTGTGSVLHTAEVKDKIAAKMRARIRKKKPDYSFEKFCKECAKSFTPKIKERFCSVDCKERNRIKKWSEIYSHELSKEFFEQLYIVEEKSTTQIAEILGCAQPTVLRYLKKFGIETRNRSGKNYWKPNNNN